MTKIILHVHFLLNCPLNATIVLVKDDEIGTENPWKTQHFSLLLLTAAAKVSVCVTYLQAGAEGGEGRRNSHLK